MLGSFRDRAAIAELEPLLVEYDALTGDEEGDRGGCPLLYAELINNLGLAYGRTLGRETDVARLQERVQREAPYFAKHGLIVH